MMDYTNRDNTAQNRASTAAQYDVGLRKYMLRIYDYMMIGLALTGLVAYGVAQSDQAMQFIFGSPLKYVVMFSPLVFVFIIGAKIHSMSPQAAKIAFFSFAVLMGLSLSYIFRVYTGESIAKAFFITAGVFGSMSIYGYTTKKDLTGMGSFLIMGVFGLIIAGIVNLFLQSSGFSYVLSMLSVLIFTGLTAFETQRLKHMYYQFGNNTSIAIMGALSLYISFINIMISMLHLLGGRE